MSSRNVLHLSREQIIELGATDIEWVSSILRSVFPLWNTGKILQPAKTTLKATSGHEKYLGLVNTLPAAILEGQYSAYGVKVLGAMPTNVQYGIPRATGLITLFNAENKTPIAVLDAQVISAMRTGAVSALAAEVLCDPETTSVGLIGAGVNMRTQIMGILSVLKNVKTVKVYSTGKSSTDFVNVMSARFSDVQFTVAGSADEAVKNTQLVITCVANSDKPVVKASSLPSGGLTVFNIGCLENEPQLLESMDLTVADYWEHSKHRGVQTHAVAYAQGVISDDSVVDMFDIFDGKKPGRVSPSQRIFFCPTGLGFEDVALAKALFDKATEQKVGTELEMWGDQPWI